MQIIEAFDATSTIQEVKLTFEAMSKALNLSKETSKKVSITEGLASKSVATTKPATKNVVETEVNEMASRFQKLAGIKK